MVEEGQKRKRINPLQNVLRDGNHIVVEELNPEQLAFHQKKQKRFARKKAICSVPGFDETIYKRKWYPGTYDKEDNLIIIPQGWWHRSIGKQWWRHKLSLPDIDRLVFFFKGSEVLEKNYTIKNEYYYNNIRFRIIGKIQFPLEVRLSKTRKSFKAALKKATGSDGSTKETEKAFYKALFRTLPKIAAPKQDKDTIINRNLKQNRANGNNK